MQLIIDIPEHIYEHAKETTEDSRDEFDAMRAIANGTQQESGSEIPNTCGDAISRQAVDDAIYDYSRSCNVDYSQIMEYIEKLPSVTPQQRTGRWIDAEVLDKIRAEIERKAHSGQWSDATMYGMLKAIAIIDKYKAESEGKE